MGSPFQGSECKKNGKTGQDEYLPGKLPTSLNKNLLKGRYSEGQEGKGEQNGKKGVVNK